MSEFKLFSWNVNGIRAGIKKGLWEKVDQLNPDILCMQETKSDSEIMSSNQVLKSGYDFKFHSCSMKKGYSGVATYYKSNKLNSDMFQTDSQSSDLELLASKVGLGDEEFDVEGRLVTTYFKTTSGKKFCLINGYFPQGGRGPHRIEYKIKFYQAVSKLAQEIRAEGTPVIICGDLNTTVGDIDLARPKENRQTTGCLPEERDALNLFLNNGFIDSFRYFYPDTPNKYTYWDQITRARERNVGWRIDFFLVDETLKDNLISAEIHDQVFGSDHCPISITLKF